MTPSIRTFKALGLRSVRWAALLTVVLVSAAAGFALHALFSPPGPQAASVQGDATEYTCSMHPQIRLDDPDALCPICNMGLIPVVDTGGRSRLRSFSTSPAAAALMEIRTQPVRRRFVDAAIRMVGRIDYDETRLTYVTARMPGRLDRLFVNYTGVQVGSGDHMAEIYSPELLTAQQELLQASQSVQRLGEQDSEFLRSTTRASLQSAREKLRLWGLTTEQIDAIIDTGKVTDHLTIHSPVSGVVIEKNAKEGSYVQTGMRIYTVADLSRMWVRLEAYESDLAWLRYGQKVEFTVQAFPGETFSGTVSFVDPVLDLETRTVNLRLIVENPDRRLKPGMYVRAIAHSRVAAGGRVMDPDLAGKWISPMHPEIVKDQPGQCDVCGMDLVPAEELGFVSAEDAAARPLVIPASAPLITGKRAVVYVRTDPSLLDLQSVTDWGGLIATLRGHVLAREAAALREPEAQASSPMDVFWSLLPEALREDLMEVSLESPPLDVRHRFVRAVNEILREQDLNLLADWKVETLDAETRGLIELGPRSLTPHRRTRLNRMLLSSLVSGVFGKARQGPTFEGRQIVLGPRAGDWYLVRQGLNEGQEIVTRGAFKIDSALQIQARPSMMEEQSLGPEFSGQTPPLPLDPTNRKQMLRVIEVGQSLQVREDSASLNSLHSRAMVLVQAIDQVQPDRMAPTSLLLWRELSMRMENLAVLLGETDSPAEAQGYLQELDKLLETVGDRYELAGALTRPAGGGHDH